MFINELERSPDDQMIVKGIVAMADALGVKVLAKGVEREGQAEMLKDFGCRLAQGYYFGHPASAEEFTGLLERSGAFVC
jgi:EAL domain-containing protein (putative c-di-GMP-specific phosphodiesterase class I)